MQKAVYNLVVTLALFSSIYGGGQTSWAIEQNISDCSTDGSCNRKGVEAPKLPDVNFLKDQSNCNGILNRADQVAFLKKVSQINEDFLLGKTDLKERGEKCSEVMMDMIKVNHLEGDKKNQALSKMTDLVFQESTSIAENTAKVAALYAKNHDGKISPAYAQALARVGKASNAKQYVIDTSKPLEGSMQAISSIGIKQNAQGSLDFSGMKVSAQQIAGDAKLKTALGLYVGVAPAQRLSDPKRVDVLPGAGVVFLPPKADGSIPVVSTKIYNEDVKITAANLRTAIGSYLSNSQASTTTGREVQRLGGFGNHELAAKTEAWDNIQKAAKHLQTLGVAAGGLDKVNTMITQAKAAGDADEQRGKEKLKAIETAVGVTLGAGVVAKGLSWWAGSEEAGGAVAEIRNLANGANKAEHVMETMSSSVEGAGSLQKVVREAMGTATIENMAPMATMPFIFSTASSVINAGIDAKSGNGNFFCRLGSDMTEKFAGNLMMANFAWSAPLATFAGGGVEALTAGKVGAESVTALVNTGTGVYFTAQAGKQAGPGLKNCAQGLANATSSTWSETAKTCVQAGMDTAFLYTGTVEMANHAIHSDDMIHDARVNATNDFDQKTSDRQKAQANIDAAQDRAATGMLREGDKFKDSDGNSYRVVQSLSQDGKGIIVGVNEKTGQAVSVPADRLAGATAKMSFKIDTQKLAEAQARYNSLPSDVDVKTDVASRDVAGKPEAETDTAATDQDVTNKKPSTPLTKLQINVALKLDGIWKKVVDKAHSATNNKFNKAKAAAEDNISMELITQDLPEEDLVKLDKMLETKKGTEEVQKMVEEARIDCGGLAKNDSHGWDPEEQFKGILYAQNEASCWL